MYFCYTDESGDWGEYDAQHPEKSGSRYFILCGLILPSKNWKSSLETLKAYRKLIARQAYLPYDVEFHCSDMIDTHKTKAYTQISIPDRWKLISGFAETIGQYGAFSIICVVIDKSKNVIDSQSYMTEAVANLYIAYDQFLRSNEENGILFFDRANEKHITTHARKLLGTGSSGTTIPGVRIGWVVEDPIFRTSSDSIFIQAADVIAYTLKEKEFPQTSRKKFNADKIFDKKLSGRLFKPAKGGVDGIIRV